MKRAATLVPPHRPGRRLPAQLIAAVGLILSLVACGTVSKGAADIPSVASSPSNGPRDLRILVGQTGVDSGAKASVTVTSLDGAYSKTLTVTSEGVNLTVPNTTAVTVTIDVDTLPEGYSLRDESTRTQQVTLADSTTTVGFTLKKVMVRAGSTTWSLSSNKGYSFDMTMTVYKPVTDGTNGDNKIGSRCEFDADKDVAIPATVKVTATTEGFDTPITIAFLAEHDSERPYTGNGDAPVRGDDRLRVEQYYSDETVCRSWSSTDYWGYGGGDAAIVKWQEPLKNGASATHTFTVIVKNVRTPNTPDGDPDLLDWIELRPVPMAVNNPETGQFSRVIGGGLTLSGDEVD